MSQQIRGFLEPKRQKCLLGPLGVADWSTRCKSIRTLPGSRKTGCERFSMPRLSWPCVTPSAPIRHLRPAYIPHHKSPLWSRRLKKQVLPFLPSSGSASLSRVFIWFLVSMTRLIDRRGTEYLKFHERFGLSSLCVAGLS
jgi:hypothetical protein